ncbi:MAG: cupredoxin domain-containing protein [Acidobacteriota bacterium]|nr:cupredoxin domain-containing protein [Acidobacteriota bacterium]
MPPGGAVTWTNQDEGPHTLVSNGGEPIQSNALDTNQSFSYTLAHPGSYDYFCSVHPMMTGRIIVKPAGKI